MALTWLQNFKAFAFAESGSSRNNREIQRFSLSILPALDVASSVVNEQVDDSFIPSFWTSISRPKSKTIFQLFCICSSDEIVILGRILCWVSISMPIIISDVIRPTFRPPGCNRVLWRQHIILKLCINSTFVSWRLLGHYR